MKNQIFNMLCKIPIIGNRIKKNNVRKEVKQEELKAIEGHKYKDFKEFLKNAPKYTIDETQTGKLLRLMMESVGAEFQQYVFIDKSSPVDKTAWLRRDGNILLHSNGTYLLPWDSQKEIIYFDIQDMRPLIDRTKDMNWFNPDACADIVTAITNAHTMEGMQGNDGLAKLIYIIIAAIVINILLSIVGIYAATETADSVKTAIDLVKSGNFTINYGG